MQRKQIISIAVIALLIVAGIFALVLLNGKEQAESTSSAAKQNSSRCTYPLALSLAKKDRLPQVHSCRFQEFTTDTNEKITYVEVNYKDATQRGGKDYFVNNKGQVVATAPKTYDYPDLSLGSANPDCKFVWTNDVRALAQLDPEHVRRSLIKTPDSYRWKLELTKFTGFMAGDPAPPKCIRTGVLTTDLSGSDVQVLGTPEIELR
jgi:hypothetical protein